MVLPSFFNLFIVSNIVCWCFFINPLSEHSPGCRFMFVWLFILFHQIYQQIVLFLGPFQRPHLGFYYRNPCFLDLWWLTAKNSCNIFPKVIQLIQQKIGDLLSRLWRILVEIYDLLETVFKNYPKKKLAVILVPVNLFLDNFPFLEVFIMILMKLLRLLSQADLGGRIDGL